MIPAIRNLADVKKALENIRAYFKGLEPSASRASQTSSSGNTLILPGIDLTSSDLTLNAASPQRFIEVDAGSSTYSIIAPNVPGKEYVVVNKDGAKPVTIKVSGLTGVTIAVSKRATVYCDGTDYVRVTNDQ